MTTIRTTTIAALAGLMLLLTACTSPADAAPSEAQEQVRTAAPTDEQMCWQYADVLTLVGNMNAANNEGRLIGNEWDGILRLAMRQIDNIDVDDTTDVGSAIAVQQKAIDDSHGGAMSHPDPELVETWTGGPQTDAVQGACYAAVPDWGVEGWVGG